MPFRSSLAFMVASSLSKAPWRSKKLSSFSLSCSALSWLCSVCSASRSLIRKWSSSMAVFAFSLKTKICDSTSCSSLSFSLPFSLPSCSISILHLTTSGWHSSCTFSSSFSLMAAPPCSLQNSAGAGGSLPCSLSRFCSLSLTTSLVLLSEVSSFFASPRRDSTSAASLPLSSWWASLSEASSERTLSRWFLDSSSKFSTTFPRASPAAQPSLCSLSSSALALRSSCCSAWTLPMVSSCTDEVFFTVLALWANLSVDRVSSSAETEGDTFATKLRETERERSSEIIRTHFFFAKGALTHLHLDIPPKEFLSRKVSLESL